MTPYRPTVRGGGLVLAVALFLLAFANRRFWQVAFAGLPAGTLAQAEFVAGFGAVLLALILVVLLPLAFGRALKPWLVLVLLLSSVAAFFMHDYGAVVDRFALQSVAETDLREAGEWLSGRAVTSLLLLGVLPAALVLWVRVPARPWRAQLAGWLKLAGLTAALLAFGVAIGGREIASTVRNHKQLRYLMNPVSLVSATLSWRAARGDGTPVVVQPLGRDARRTGAMAPGDRPLLLVLVVGESARAQSFQLDGYPRPTNPELSRLPVVNFPDVRSCGTNTAVSLPCMFSDLGRDDYAQDAAAARENLLDVLAHAGFRVDWYDNNTGSKGVAARAREELLAELQDPRYCTYGCWDGLLVERLRRELAKTAGDRVIVLHTKGSHGPAYYLRYPPAFERFRPACRSNELTRCTRAEILNAYDNTILYTDHVLASAIAALAAQAGMDSALVYVSDHGESTGEHGLYLHGAPYLLAPDEQTRVPMLLWLSDGFRARRGLDAACVERARLRPASHDNLFDLVLGLAGVRSAAYRARLDPFAGCAAR
ncbi:MAG TPA: phosphoethanolamine--lipid A transferase [Xanthomonadaceae bacterium]|nr:phosphoethanolamine--lipid A transferase [Xanthomonadaceae bacterium]